MSPSSESERNPDASSSSGQNDSSHALQGANANEEEDTQMTIQKMLPIRMISKVVPGFGRGSKDLGIPTANLSPAPRDLQCQMSFDSLPTGIYYGFARLAEPPEQTEGHDAGAAAGPRALRGVYKAAISIGYNPCYQNAHKTLEPHLIAPPGHPSRNVSACGETQFRDLYDETMRVSIVGYLRPELPFAGLDKLIAAIKADIAKTEDLCNEESPSMAEEKGWVLSTENA